LFSCTNAERTERHYALAVNFRTCRNACQAAQAKMSRVSAQADGGCDTSLAWIKGRLTHGWMRPSGLP
jgi:hypothetical protein